MHHSLQFTGYGVRVVFERWGDGAADERDAADQNPRCNQIADQGVMREEFERDRARRMTSGVTHKAFDTEMLNMLGLPSV